MKTKESIKQKALELFNVRGIRNVTLREIAKALDRAYGNITYHFPQKEQLISALYADMIAALKEISGELFSQERGLLRKVLEAPRSTFALSMKFQFLYTDYVEIRRNYPTIAEEVDRNNRRRMQGLKAVLVELQRQGALRADLGETELEYLMELSGAMRTFFFLKLRKEELGAEDLEDRYVTYVNQLLIPYLSEEGLNEMKG